MVLFAFLFLLLLPLTRIVRRRLLVSPSHPLSSRQDLRLDLVVSIRFTDVHGWYPVGDDHRFLAFV